MNLVRRLLSHSLLILVVVGLIYAYTQRDILYPYLKLSQIEKREAHPKDSGGSVAREPGVAVEPVTAAMEEPQGGEEETVPALAARGANHAGPVASSEATDTLGATVTPGTMATPDTTADVAPDAAEDGAEASTGRTVDAAKAMPPESGVAQPDVEAAPEAAEAASELVETAQAAGVEAGQPVPVAQPAAVRGTTQTPASANEAIRLARQAYWRRDLASAEAYYRKAIELDANAVDAYGELGNIYLQGGRYQDAAGVYYEAANRLQTSGQIAKALPLLRLMYRLDPERASRLERTIRENGKRPDDPRSSESAP